MLSITYCWILIFFRLYDCDHTHCSITLGVNQMNRTYRIETEKDSLGDSEGKLIRKP